MRRVELEEQAAVVDHHLAVLVPVVVLTDDRAVVLHQRVNGGVVG